MRIGLVTTLDTNIGDDFIRIGLVAAARAAAGTAIDFVSINKHNPLSILPAGHPLRSMDDLPRGRERAYRLLRQVLRRPLKSTVFDDCDLLLQCGAPILWHRVGTSATARFLWEQTGGRFAARGKPFLNLGGGASFPWRGREAAPSDASAVDFARYIGGIAAHTTVRDTLCQDIFRMAGHSVARVACPALLAAQTFASVPAADGGDLVLLNYMPGGGHSALGQTIDADTWRGVFTDLAARLKLRHQVALICHSSVEAEKGRALGLDIPVIHPQSPAAYFDVAARAKAGVFNRMHAAVAFAGLGIPSIAVGNDTRLLMVEGCGLPTRFTPEATAASLEADVEALMQDRAQQRERLLALRRATWERYVALFTQAFAR